MTVPDTGHWATIEPFIRDVAMPGYVEGEDRLRLAAYDMYEAIYWTAPYSFQLTMRGQEGDPLYVPSGRKIVDTAHRYTAPGLSVAMDPTFGDEGQRTDAIRFFNDFAARERFLSKFSAAKLYGQMRGDWGFHIMADEERPDGTRVSIHSLHPGTVFPEWLDDDLAQMIAVHLVEPSTNDKGDPVVLVTHYRKETGKGGPSPILTETVMYKAEEWGQPGTEMKTTPLQQILPEQTLPAPIDALPVYMIPNSYETDFPWGSSEMRGVEHVMRGLNQAITDEELALVLEGLGVYVTDAGAPLDPENGEELPWSVAPGRVIELPGGKTFQRVSGVNTITPYMDHLRYLEGWMDRISGENDVTSGRAEVQVAESGIALTLRMGPLLHRSGEKELIITDVMGNMLFDLRKWFTAYETGLSFDDVRFMTTYADKIPVNRAQAFQSIIAMATSVPPIISAAEARRQLIAIGWEFIPEAQLEGEIQSDAERVADASAVRISGASAALNEPTEEELGEQT